MSPSENIIEVRAKKLENGWFVEIVNQVSYDAIKTQGFGLFSTNTKGYIFKSYAEMLDYFVEDLKKERL